MKLWLVFLCIGFARAWNDFEKGPPEDVFEAMQQSRIPEQFPEGRFESARGDFNAGFLTYSIGSGDDASRAVILQTDGKFVLVGRTLADGRNDFAILRLHPDGELDTSYNTTGRVITTLGAATGATDVYFAAVLQTDGKVIAVGKSDNETWFGNYGYHRFAAVRYNTNGTLDTSFFTTGTTIHTLRESTAYIGRAAQLDTAGQLVVAGTSWDGSGWHAPVFRYLTDGALDTSFHSDGKLLVSILVGGDSGALALALDTSNRIVIGGPVYNVSDWDFGIARIISGGVLDTTFNSSGTKTFAILSSDDILNAIQVDPNGKIVALGSTYMGSGDDMAVARLLSDGAFDTTFHSDGKMNTSYGSGADSFTSVFIQSDSKLIGGGYTHNGSNNDFAVFRILTNGILDTTFSSSGRNQTAINAAEDTAQGMMAYDDQSLVVVGRSDNGTSYDFSMIRLATNGALALAGALDVSFGGGTKNVDLFAGGDDTGGSANTHYGKPLFVGNEQNVDFNIVRLNLDATLDTTFSNDGKARFALSGSDYSADVAVQTDGLIVVGGTANSDFAAIRLLTSGLLDTTFHSDGIMLLNVSGGDGANAVVIQTAGEIVLAGKDGTADMTVLRLLSDGVLDTTFHSDGIQTIHLAATDDATHVRLLSDERIALVGATNTYTDIGFVQLLTDGSMDTSFSNDGKITFGISGNDSPRSLVVQEDNKLLTAVVDATVDFLVLRYTSTGVYDTTFHTDGMNRVGFFTDWFHRGIAKQTNSKIVTSALSASGANSHLIIMRYLTDGSLDTTFASDGSQQSALSMGIDYQEHPLFVKPNGKILNCGVGNAGADITCAQYWP